MNLKDLIVLAKAGYTPAQVKEILAMPEASKTEEPKEPAETAPKEDAQPEPAKEPQEEEPKASEDKNEQLHTLEEKVGLLTTELAKTKEELAIAQKNNLKKDNSKEKQAENTIEDIFRGFM